MTWIDLLSNLMTEHGLMVIVIALLVLIVIILILLFVFPRFKDFFKQLKDVTQEMKTFVSDMAEVKAHNSIVDAKIEDIKEKVVEDRYKVAVCVEQTENIINKMVEGNKKAFAAIDMAIQGLQETNEKIREMIQDLNNDLTKVREAHAQLLGEHNATHKNFRKTK